MSSLRQERENRRHADRRPTFIPSRICYGAQDSVTLPCTIRNLSGGGAMLEVAEVSLLPLSFRVVDASQGVAYDCKVIWRRGNEVGVAFAQTFDLNAKADLGARALSAVRKALLSR